LLFNEIIIEYSILSDVDSSIISVSFYLYGTT
jgi:hypothetical protein